MHLKWRGLHCMKKMKILVFSPCFKTGFGVKQHLKCLYTKCCFFKIFFSFFFGITDNAVPRQTEVPFWTEEEILVRNSTATSAVPILHSGTTSAPICDRDEDEKPACENKTQG